MKRQSDFTPDTAAQVRSLLDDLRTIMSADPDLDTLLDAVTDWNDDVANSDASDDDRAACEALADCTKVVFRLLAALTEDKMSLVIFNNDWQATFEWHLTEDSTVHPEFAATVESAVRRSLGKVAHA